MTTPYDVLFNAFMMTQEDWRLKLLWTNSVEDFEAYVMGFLTNAVAEFEPKCKQSLECDDTTKTFTQTLTKETVSILAMLMHKYWLAKELNDVNQFRLTMDDHDFKRGSPSINLQAKMKLYDDAKEECSQRLTDYSYDHASFSDWSMGRFI
jgi:hypothetical protein